MTHEPMNQAVVSPEYLGLSVAIESTGALPDYAAQALHIVVVPEKTGSSKNQKLRKGKRR